MWAAIYDQGGGSGTHQCGFSHLHWQHPAKLWIETVNRLWRLRRQHWHQASSHSRHHLRQPHLLQKVPHQHTLNDHSHKQHLLPCHPRSSQNRPHPCPHAHSQHAYHSQSRSNEPYGSLPNAHLPIQQDHSQGNWLHQHSLSLHDNRKHPHNRACQQGHQQHPLHLTTCSLPHGLVINKEKCRFRSELPNVRSKANGLPGSAGDPKPTQIATPLNQQYHEIFHSQKGVKRSSLGWSEEVLPVPPDLVKETDAKALCHMVDKHVESYVHELKQSSSTPHRNYDLLKPSPIIHAGSLYHFKPPNLGQRDFEEWVRKHRRKKMSKSGCANNVAFGRSISSPRCKSTTSVVKVEAKNDTSFIKCMRGKLNARREVLKAIQDYHINAEARAQLEKRASEFEEEKKERQRKKAASRREAALERRSRQSSVVNTLSK